MSAEERKFLAKALLENQLKQYNELQKLLRKMNKAMRETAKAHGLAVNFTYNRIDDL